MQHKGDFRATGAASTSGIDLHAAYAFHEHFAVAGSASLPATTINDEDRSIEFLGMLGGYFPFGNGGIFEIYGGGGGGRLGFYETRGEVITAFSQFNIGYTSQFFDAAFLTRLAYRNFDGMSDYAPTQAYTVEPGLLLRLGFRHIKAESQLMFPLPPHENQSVYIIPIVFTIGVSTHFNLSGPTNEP